MKKIWGNIIFFVARLLELIFNGLISIMSFLVNIVEGIRAFLAPMLGCFGIMIFYNWFLILPFINPAYLLFILILLVFPLLGRSFVSFLEYGEYVLTEYLFDRADYYRFGREGRKDFSSYGSKYRREKMRQEQRAREENQRRQNEEWERIFNEFFRNGGGYGGYGGGYSNRGQGGYYGNFNGYGQNAGNNFNPIGDFVEKYKKSCDTLGLDYDTDEYQVKLAYRKMAKKYHPDLNKEPGATEKFREVNEAYEFMSKENIERYKSMNK